MEWEVDSHIKQILYHCWATIIVSSDKGTLCCIQSLSLPQAFIVLCVLRAVRRGSRRPTPKQPCSNDLIEIVEIMTAVGCTCEDSGDWLTV